MLAQVQAAHWTPLMDVVINMCAVQHDRSIARLLALQLASGSAAYSYYAVGNYYRCVGRASDIKDLVVYVRRIQHNIAAGRSNYGDNSSMSTCENAIRSIQVRNLLNGQPMTYFR